MLGRMRGAYVLVCLAVRRAVLPCTGLQMISLWITGNGNKGDMGGDFREQKGGGLCEKGGGVIRGRASFKVRMP